jgi:hypothetical protein
MKFETHSPIDFQFIMEAQTFIHAAKSFPI